MGEQTYISVAKAAEIAEVSVNTIRRWCETFKIGAKVGGRWRIFPDLLDKILNGEIEYEEE